MKKALAATFVAVMVVFGVVYAQPRPLDIAEVTVTVVPDTIRLSWTPAPQSPGQIVDLYLWRLYMRPYISGIAGAEVVLEGSVPATVTSVVVPFPGAIMPGDSAVVYATLTARNTRGVYGRTSTSSPITVHAEDIGPEPPVIRVDTLPSGEVIALDDVAFGVFPNNSGFGAWEGLRFVEESALSDIQVGGECVESPTRICMVIGDSIQSCAYGMLDGAYVSRSHPLCPVPSGYAGLPVVEAQWTITEVPAAPQGM